MSEKPSVFLFACVLIAVIALFNIQDIRSLYQSHFGPVGNGKNALIKDYDKRDASLEEKDYGKVLHHGMVAEQTVIKGIDINDNISMITFTNKAKGNIDHVVLLCDSRSRALGIMHDIKNTNTGEPVFDATDVSIMNYKQGVVNITESDESRIPLFSTAENQVDIVKSLQDMDELNPDSTIAFTFEMLDRNDYSYAVGWSTLMRVKDVLNGLRKVDLSKCKGTSVGEDGGSIIYKVLN